MTLGRGHFGALNLALLLAAVVGAALFLRVEVRTATPLIHLATIGAALRASLVTSALVSTVMMATLVVGPFYLAGALGLEPAAVGLVLSIGPLVTALTGVPAGRIADRFGVRRVILAGLAAMAAGCLFLSISPATVLGYIAPIVVTTIGYALFQTANNTAVMSDIAPDQRGVVSGLINLARNLGLVTGASAMGAVFAFASERAGGAAGMRITFAVAAGLIALAVAVAAASRRKS
jgi:MFS family permease